MALLVCGGMGWNVYRNFQLLEEPQPIAERMQRLGSQMHDLESLMTLSAQMTAASGDLSGENRYLRAEPELARLIAEARRLQPTAPAGTGAARLHTANVALVRVQHAAFDLVRQGNPGPARQLLSSESQELQRERFAQGLVEFMTRQMHAHDLADAALARSRRTDAFRTITAIPILVLILILGLLLVFRAIRRWQTLFVESNRELSRKAEELSEFNAQLDKKVSDRTQELTDSAIASLNMMEDAVRQREETEQAQDKLNYLAHYDALTGLANQTLFLQRVQAKLLATHGNQLLVVFTLDILRFKSINSALGGQAGDDLLNQIAERLVSAGGGDSDRFARIGAHRFAAVATDMGSAEHAGRYASQRLDAVFHPPFRIAETNVHVSVKVGIALFPVDGANADTLLHNAEAALKKAKATGEMFLFFTESMTELVAERLSLEHRLRQAIDNEEFVLHYQPKVNLVTGKLTGAEALIRWNDPATGLVAPAVFIPILEEMQLIQAVGCWAMRKAVGHYLRWRDLGMAAVPIAVNVSSMQLRNHAFLDELRQVVAIDGRAAEGLELEITESMLMDDIEHAAVTLREIRAMGVRIAIDDFGTGFSSLAYLSRLPIDTLKIDQAFVTDMMTGTQGIALVNAIITLAHSLHLKAVAEGVETQEQLHMLQSLHCDEIQGYLLSKPISQDLFESRFLTMTATAPAGAMLIPAN
ncbi:MAG: bifunctional diguanylate cyclase/phosphodiesterase [Rhodanobacter sp.]